MDGWLRLYRKLKEHWLWDDRPFSKGQAWIDILFRCNHKCIQHMVDGRLKWILRGQFIYSNVKFASDWGWSEKSVRRFIKTLSDNDMLTTQPTNHFTVYEVLKYAELQALDTEEFEAATCRTKDEQKPSKRRTKAEQMPTDNNDNKYKNDKKIKDIKIFSPESWEVKFATGLKKMILINNPTAKTPDDIQNWAKGFDMILRVDKRNIDEVSEVLRYSQQVDVFWRKNILSPDSFRSHYDKLKMLWEEWANK
jgi:hypothetical protein